MQDKWVFAYLYKNQYYAEQIVDSNQIEGLEYEDANSHQYQLWHWPSGDIYDIKTSDSGATNRSFKLPKYTDRNDQPWAVLNTSDKNKVSAAIAARGQENDLPT